MFKDKLGGIGRRELESPRFISATCAERRETTRAQLSLPGTNAPNDLAVNGTRHAVLQLEVHLGDCVFLEYGGIRDIAWAHNVSTLVSTGRRTSMITGNEGDGMGAERRQERTDGSGLDHVADGESLDGLILGGASRAVGAADGLRVATTLLLAAAVEKLRVSSGRSGSQTTVRKGKQTCSFSS